jgi:ketosteroid isomerase-like protein
MSQENVDLVMRAMTAAFKRPKPDFDTVNALFHPDHVFVPVQAKVEEMEAVGASGYKSWLDHQDDLWAWQLDVGGAVDVGRSTVLFVGTIRVRGASSGAPADQRLWTVVTVEQGQITRSEAFLDWTEALEAVGLRD